MKTKLIILAMSICAVFSSCNNNHDEDSFSQDESISHNELNGADDMQGTKDFFNSVDSLNVKYSHVKTRGFFSKWGGRIFTAVVDYSVGAVASAATTPLGGAIIGSVASFAYEDYWNSTMKKMEEPNNVNAVSTRGLIETTPALILSNNENPTFADSVGYYHNILLAELRALGKSYCDSYGNLDYQGMMDDMVVIARMHGIECENIDIVKKNNLFKLTDSFLKDVNTENDNFIGTYFEQHGNSILSNLGFSDNCISSYRTLCSKIAEVVPYSTETEVIEYGNKLHTMIDNSNLSDANKENFKIMNDVAVNSQLYWAITE